MTNIGVGTGRISTGALVATRDGTSKLAVDDKRAAAVAEAGTLATSRVESANEAVGGAAGAVVRVHLVALLLADDGVGDRLEDIGVVARGVDTTPAGEEAIVSSDGRGIDQRDGLDRVAEGNGLSGLEKGNVVVNALGVQDKLGVGLNSGDLVELALADLVAASTDGNVRRLPTLDAVASRQDVARANDGTTTVKFAIEVELNLVRNRLDVGVLSAPDVNAAGGGGSKGLSGKAEDESRLHCDA